MLYDSGAAVGAVDKDGRSPLMLAAQTGHTRACQQLLTCGASVDLQDKQNKTALILAVEHVCHEVVEVLLKHKADVSAEDIHGHDSSHYASLSGDQALITMIKQAWDAASKESSKTGLKLEQQRSVSNETHTHVRKMSVKAPARGPPSGISGPNTALPQQHTVRHYSPHSAAAGSFKAKEVQAGEAELLRKELWEMRQRHDATQEELLRLDRVLVLRTWDYEELRRSSERALQQAHNHAWELQEALEEVQHRMVGSEARVKQMQAHLVAVRENVVEDLRVQLLEARTEVQRAHEMLDHNRREAKQQKEKNDMLLQKVQNLNEELLKKEELNALPPVLASDETQRTDSACKETQTPSEWKPDSPKSTMTDLTSETLQREMNEKLHISREEHESIRSSFSTALQQAQCEAQEALLRQQKTNEENQSLIRELQEQKMELDTLQEALQARFVPVSMLEMKDKELAELRFTLKQMEERKKSDEQEGMKARSVESQEYAQPDPVRTGRTPEENTSSLTTPAEGQHEGSGIIKEAKDQMAAENSSSSPSSVRSLVHSDSTILQAHIKSLQQQLENSERHYRQLLGVYRTHLICAAQGYMDEEAKLALLQIAKMRQECVC